MLMAACRRTLTSSSTLRFLLNQTLRFKTTTSSSISSPDHQHDFSKPCDFLGSWSSPPSKDPREANANLGKLRRDYAWKLKELRKEYFYEMELQRQEKERKDEAKREAIRLAKEQRKAAKAAVAQTRAAERKVLEEEFRQTLLKERMEKLENWKAKEERRDNKKKEKNDLLRQQSSMWIDENELEKKILEAMVDTKPL
eukprot:TRINITY_DN989_c0_g1_i2.p1 TRINITY_DN989_c0_g1~~TRINITY_DN989_c0_g1_i2.p1  ORF type:complete len:198 (+),score=41.36 TRINITY_DN989_c0_g1_i2:251-844(+)